ncbi:MAG: nucleotide exchange factor GrpE [Dysgonamonadaceae bacterium]|jgi:molecular chaperone GrpE|nr:nucleotide exchange factor GrpE [Dysgonamonadaceae bacterium]
MKKKRIKKMNKQVDPESAAKGTDFADNLADFTTKGQTEEITPENETGEIAETAAEELERTKDAHLRLMAEYDNYRKRTIKEKADLIRNGGEKTLTALLPVVDDFERALQTIEKATDIEALKEGVSLIFSKFQTYLAQNGVKKIETAEQPFDADIHEAVAMIPATDESKKSKIIDTVQAGYMLNDKVIRHAKVVVAN